MRENQQPTGLTPLALAAMAALGCAPATAPPTNISLGAQPVAVLVGADASNPRATRLRIVGMSAASPLGVLFSVYWGAAPAGGFGRNDPRYLGTLSFYDAVRSPDGLRAAANASFDLAGPLRRIRAAGLKPDGIITIVPSGPPADSAKPAISAISVVVP